MDLLVNEAKGYRAVALSRDTWEARLEGGENTTELFMRTGVRLVCGTKKEEEESLRRGAPPLRILPIPPAPLGRRLGGESESSPFSIAQETFSLVKREPWSPMNLTSLNLWRAFQEPSFLPLGERTGSGLLGLVIGSSSIGTTLLKITEPLIRRANL